jgi:hypothetical protein
LRNGHKPPNSINKDGYTNKASKTSSVLPSKHEKTPDKETPLKDDSPGIVGVVEAARIEDREEIPGTPPPMTPMQWIPVQEPYGKQPRPMPKKRSTKQKDDVFDAANKGIYLETALIDRRKPEQPMPLPTLHRHSMTISPKEKN